MKYKVFRNIKMGEASGFSTTFTLSGKKSEIRVQMPVQLHLDPKYRYEIGLVWFSTYNTVYNIHDENNWFYLFRKGKMIPAEIKGERTSMIKDKIEYTYVKLSLKIGAWGFKEINQKVLEMTNNAVKLETDEKTSLSKISILENYYVEFEKKSFLHSMHGFEKISVEKWPTHKLFTGDSSFYFIDKKSIVIDPITDYESKYTFQITDINICNIDCSIANGGYVSMDKQIKKHKYYLFVSGIHSPNWV